MSGYCRGFFQNHLRHFEYLALSDFRTRRGLRISSTLMAALTFLFWNNHLCRASSSTSTARSATTALLLSPKVLSSDQSHRVTSRFHRYQNYQCHSAFVCGDIVKDFQRQRKYHHLILRRVTTQLPAQQFDTMTTSFDKDGADNKKNGTQFGRFWIDEECIFYRTSLSVAFVNLRPIVRGHVLVIPIRVVPHLQDLESDEYDDLWRTVRVVQSILQKRHENGRADASTSSHLSFNVAVQDGKFAGQSVPHVHVHILPRISGDFVKNDDIYDSLEMWTPKDLPHAVANASTIQKQRLIVPSDEERRDRTIADMTVEAKEYRDIVALLDKKT
jgi:bis(5'-adenosyl)-triphosphatase